jgi:hypothetical protein
LVNIEGLNFNHPLRLRLLQHLQNFTNDQQLVLDQSHFYSPSSCYSNSTDFINSSSSSSCSSSPKKFDSNTKKTIDYPLNQKLPQVLNNSAFVQINITANNSDDDENKICSNNFQNTNDNYHYYWNQNQNQVQLSNFNIQSNQIISYLEDNI